MDDILDCFLPTEFGRGGHRLIPSLASALHTHKGFMYFLIYIFGN